MALSMIFFMNLSPLRVPRLSSLNVPTFNLRFAGSTGTTSSTASVSIFMYRKSATRPSSKWNTYAFSPCAAFLLYHSQNSGYASFSESKKGSARFIAEKGCSCKSICMLIILSLASRILFFSHLFSRQVTRKNRNITLNLSI